MPDTEDGSAPFFSPDGAWVGFTSNNTLRKVALAGGPAQTLVDALSGGLRGADWGTDEMIVYGAGVSSLMQVSSAGGEPITLVDPDPADERRSWWPQVLPTGDVVLYTKSDPGPDSGELRLLMLETGEQRTLLPAAVAGRVLSTGHLVFLRSGALWAVPFDFESLDTVGNPAPVIEGVRVEGGGAVQFALAADGSLIYIPGTRAGGERRLNWVDRSGNEEPLTVLPNNYSHLDLSTDGTRAAFGILGDSGNSDVWISELARGTLTRLTTDDAIDRNPLWSPDGLRVVFSSNRGGKWGLFSQAADGSGQTEGLLSLEESVTDVAAYDWSPDEETLYVQVFRSDTGSDLGMVSVGGTGTWEPLLQTTANERRPAVSPDGRWLAYDSNETGNQEVYVQRLPELVGRRQISVGGGCCADWSEDGREITYLRAPIGAADAVMGVTLDIDESDPSSLSVGTPERLFEYRYYGAPGGRRWYDASTDGQRFLVIATGASENDRQGRAEINVVLNWFEELKERVPVP